MSVVVRCCHHVCPLVRPAWGGDAVMSIICRWLLPAESCLGPYGREGDAGRCGLVDNPVGGWPVASPAAPRAGGAPCNIASAMMMASMANDGQPDRWTAPYQSSCCVWSGWPARCSPASRGLYPWGHAALSEGHFCGRLGCWRVFRCSSLLLLCCWCPVSGLGHRRGVMGGGRRCLASAPPGPSLSPGRCFLLVKYLFEFSVGVGRAGLLISGLGASVRCCVVLLLCSRTWALVPDGCFALGCQFPASLTHPRSGPAQGYPAAFGKRGGQVDGSLVIGSGSRLRGRSGCRCRGVGLT